MLRVGVELPVMVKATFVSFVTLCAAWLSGCSTGSPGYSRKWEDNADEWRKPVPNKGKAPASSRDVGYDPWEHGPSSTSAKGPDHPVVRGGSVPTAAKVLVRDVQVSPRVA